jgi:fructose 1,6-bisphosphatase
LPAAEAAGFQEIEIQNETSLSDSGEGFYYFEVPIYIAGLCCGMHEGPFEPQPFTAINRSCVPGPNTFLIVGRQCEDNKTAAECEDGDGFGTAFQHHPGMSCEDDPCSNPLP